MSADDIEEVTVVNHNNIPSSLSSDDKIAIDFFLNIEKNHRNIWNTLLSNDNNGHRYDEYTKFHIWKKNLKEDLIYALYRGSDLTAEQDALMNALVSSIELRFKNYVNCYKKLLNMIGKWRNFDRDKFNELTEYRNRLDRVIRKSSATQFYFHANIKYPRSIIDVLYNGIYFKQPTIDELNKRCDLLKKQYDDLMTHCINSVGEEVSQDQPPQKKARQTPSCPSTPPLPSSQSGENNNQITPRSPCQSVSQNQLPASSPRYVPNQEKTPASSLSSSSAEEIEEDSTDEEDNRAYIETFNALTAVTPPTAIIEQGYNDILDSIRILSISDITHSKIERIAYVKKVITDLVNFITEIIQENTMPFCQLIPRLNHNNYHFCFNLIERSILQNNPVLCSSLICELLGCIREDIAKVKTIPVSILSEDNRRQYAQYIQEINEVISFIL